MFAEVIKRTRERFRFQEQYALIPCENDLFTRLKENISEKDLTKIREYMTSCEREREWEELV